MPLLKPNELDGIMFISFAKLSKYRLAKISDTHISTPREITPNFHVAIFSRYLITTEPIFT